MFNAREKVIFRLGVVQCVFGTLSLICEVIDILGDGFSFTGIPLGIFVIATGIVGIIAVKKNLINKKQCLMMAFLVMNIIAVIATSGLLMKGILGFCFDKEEFHDDDSREHGSHSMEEGSRSSRSVEEGSDSIEDDSDSEMHDSEEKKEMDESGLNLMAIRILAGLLLLAEIITCFVASTVCCGCCCSESPSTVKPCSNTNNPTITVLSPMGEKLQGIPDSNITNFQPLGQYGDVPPPYNYTAPTDYQAGPLPEKSKE